MDHSGTTVHVMKANENENEDNCSVKSNMSVEGEEGIDLTEIKSSEEINMEGITYEGVIQGNGNEEATEGDQKDDEDDNVPDVKGRMMFMKTYLEEAVSNSRFTNPQQLKFVICNYALANGYQLYFEKTTIKSYWLSVVMVNAYLGFGRHG
ncbi:unnamed protein product [Lactuca saligna]|uniref:Uncharacterized protein n=1 Tax=Lactuca saligna TaxID=75948 RepID=A0AA35V715_LACSI|nr:unnamed protein product [Lactuca saligna]